MAGIKELPVWARILIGEPTSDARNTRNPVRESDICREAAGFLAEFDQALFEDREPGCLSQKDGGAPVWLCAARHDS